MAPPPVIHKDAELEAYTDALFQLTALEGPSRSEVEAIELLNLARGRLRAGALLSDPDSADELKAMGNF
jgi:hypothetical protein